AVLTAKHHDGVALWDTSQSDLSIPARDPAGRDLIGPFAQAMRRAGLRIGIYFSHLDWSHPDYPTIVKPNGANRQQDDPGYDYSYPRPGHEDPERWEQFLAFHRAQLQELCRNYEPDLLWFDGDWERSDEQWRFGELRDALHQWCPTVVLNSRMGGHGDYLTPEQGIPIQRPAGLWEFCVTINNSWGYQPHDENHKSARQLIRMFSEVVSMGGRLLLGFGPRPDGTFPEPAVERLKALGDWIGRHDEAIHGCDAGLPHGHFNGGTTLSRDRRTLYLHLYDRPWENIAVKGIRNPVRHVSVLGHTRELAHRKIGGAAWLNLPGVLWIDVPEDVLDLHATIVRIELEGELDLYTGAGQAVTSN
ncbi:MAG: alpha-L-fucosidase, partial [Phycisphaeraceae bacterium]|nr:alpha-L-fucosidase [Phycisphaeraceae bacterium]